MNDMIPSIIVMAACIVMSAYFSATETAFSSLNKTRLRMMAENGDRRAELAYSLVENYDKLISTILIGNNIVNITVSSVGTVVFVKLYGDVGATLSTVVVTILVLIFGEITPKSVAKDSPERFAMFSAPVIRALIVVLTPLNYLFSLWKKLISRVIKVKSVDGMSQEELLMMVDEVEQGGAIDTDERELIRNAIEFNELKAEDILTHRVDLEAIPDDMPNAEIAKAFSESRYSRLLVYNESIDNIIGVVHQKDFYVGAGITDKPITEVITPPLFIHKSEKVNELLKLLQREKSHIAIVIDDYGGTLGIVTMEDILEELVGEIWDEHDEIIEEFKPQDDGSYLISCSANLDDLFDRFSIRATDIDSASISGWVLDQLGRMPVEGDHFVYENLDVTVTKLDHRRILEIRVALLPEEDDED